MTEDNLVVALRLRAADPQRRRDLQTSEFEASLKHLDSKGLRSEVLRAANSLRRLITGDLGADISEQVREYRAAMRRPADVPLPMRASTRDVEDAERAIGFALPALLRRLYTEVANGGFGPGPGLIGVHGGWTDQSGRNLAELHDVMRSGDPDQPEWAWPSGLIPIVDESPSWICANTLHSTTQITRFDYEEIDYGEWHAAFTEVSPSLHLWLESWVNAEPIQGVAVAETAAPMLGGDIAAAQQARDLIRGMSPEERRAMGLPDEGWERIVWGGIGLDPNEDGEHR